MINVYDRGRLVLVCSSKDWRLFVPGVPDNCFRWRRRACEWQDRTRWTWDWV